MTLESQIDYVKKYREVMSLNIGEKNPIDHPDPQKRKAPRPDSNGKIPWHNEINETELDLKDGLCVFCGRTSLNLMVIDIDEHSLFDSFKEYHDKTFIVKSGKRGYHIYFRTYENPKSRSLDNAKKQHIDILGQGKIAVLPPSIHPETKKPYEILSDKKIKQLTRQEEQGLHQKLKDLGFGNAEEIKNVRELHAKDLIKTKGDNGGLDLLRVIASWKVKNPELSESIILTMAHAYTNEHHDPPCTDDKVESLVKQSYGFAEKKIEEQEQNEVPTELKKQLDENWKVMKSNPTKKVRVETMTKINELEKLAGKEITPWDEEEKGDDVKLYELALSRIEKMIISKNNSHEVYAVVKIEDHFESVNLGDSRSMDWLNYIMSTELKSTSIKSTDFYKNILTAITAKAQMESVAKEHVYNRTAFVNNTLFYDLANEEHEIITVSKEGIEKIKVGVDTPIFTQSQTTITQTEPVYDDDTGLDDLVKLLQIKDEQLFKVHLVAMFLEQIPVPIMLFDGKAGSFKTTTTATIKRIIDPSGDKKEDNVISIPSNNDDIIMTLYHRYVTVLENVSKINNEISDIFCRAITGSSNTKRAHYKNLEEIIMTFRRKLIINGVVPNLDNTDLQQRIISYDRNVTNIILEEEYERKYAEIRPRVLGQIFQTLQKSMKIIGDMEFTPQTRMADFEKWGECISKSLDYPDGSFGEKYVEKLKSSAISSKDGHPIISIIEAIVVDKDYKNTMGDLFNLVRNTAVGMGIDITNKYIRFPKISNQLGKELVVVSPVLEKLGYTVEQWNNTDDDKFTKNVKMVEIKKIDRKTTHNYKCSECNTEFTTSESLEEVQKEHVHGEALRMVIT